MFPDSVADRLLTVIVTGWLTVIGGRVRWRDLSAAAFHGDSHPDTLRQGIRDHLLNRRLPLPAPLLPPPPPPPPPPRPGPPPPPAPPAGGATRPATIRVRSSDGTRTRQNMP